MLCLTTFSDLRDHYFSRNENLSVFRREIHKAYKRSCLLFDMFVVHNKMFDLPKTGLFIPDKIKLAKNMLCLTTFFHLHDHHFPKI
jgi:hypothetical protein